MPDSLLGLLKFSQFLGLILIIGVPLFQLWILPIDRVHQSDAAGRMALGMRLDRLFRIGVVVGAVLVAAGALGQAAAAAAGLPGLSTVEFLTQARVGRFLLARIVLSLLIPLVLFMGDAFLQRALAAMLGGAAAFTVSAVAHAARHGDLAILVDLLHMMAAGAWVGGLFTLALLPWQRLAAFTRDNPVESRRFIGRAAGQFSNLGGIAVVVLILSGLHAASLHVYGPEALVGSPYGQALTGKIALFLLILVAAFINRFWVTPDLLPASPRQRDPQLRLVERLGAAVGEGDASAAPAGQLGTGEGRAQLRTLDKAEENGEVAARSIVRLGRFVRWEAGLAVLVLLVTGVLTVLPPVDRPAQLADTVHLTLQAEGVEGTASLEPLEGGTVAIEVTVQQPAAVRQMTVEFDMPDHAMARQRTGLVREGDKWVGDIFLIMPGSWRAAWTLTEDTGARHRLSTPFSVGATPDYAGSQVNIIAAFADLPRGLQAAAGMLALGAALGLMAAAWLRHAAAMFLGGLGLAAVGAALFLNVAVIEAFPTTGLHNPVSAELSVVVEARELFARECAECHGAQGRGDGMVTPPVGDARLNLRDPMVQARTDGDLFWLISEGREERGMPGFRDELSERERWAMVHQVRAIGIGAMAPDDTRHHMAMIGLMFVLLSVPALVVGIGLVVVQARSTQ